MALTQMEYIGSGGDSFIEQGYYYVMTQSNPPASTNVATYSNDLTALQALSTNRNCVLLYHNDGTKSSFSATNGGGQMSVYGIKDNVITYLNGTVGGGPITATISAYDYVLFSSMQNSAQSTSITIS